MRAFRLLRFISIALAFMAAIAPSPARAGLNSGASATLTWSSTSVVSNLTTTTGTRRLYVRLSGVTSLQSFETMVVWAPTGLDDPAYELSSWSAPSGVTCAWLLRGTSVTLSAVTDSSLQVAVTADVDTSCGAGNAMVMSFSDSSAGAFPPGQFRIAYARTLDAAGDPDTLSLGSPATILSGTVYPAPVVAALAPAFGWVGFPRDYALSGYVIGDSAAVDLIRSGSSPLAGTVTVTNPTLATAHFSFATADTGLWNIRVTNNGGRFAVAPQTFTVVLPDSVGSEGGVSIGAPRTLVIGVKAGTLPLTGPASIDPQELVSGSQGIRSALGTSGATGVRCLWPEKTAQTLVIQRDDGEADSLFDFSRCYEISYSSAEAMQAALSQFRDVSDVLSVHPCSVGHTAIACDTVPLDCGTAGSIHSPSDPDFARPETSQWYLGQTDTEAETYGGRDGEDSQTSCSWAVERALAAGNSSIILGVVDSGIDIGHPDLARTYSGGGTRILPGFNFVNGNTDVTDGYGHGTMMAGIAAAIRNNGTSFTDGSGVAHGIAGVVGGDVQNGSFPDSTGVRILPVKVLGDHNEFTSARLASGIYWAVANGAKIINLSIEFGTGSTPDVADSSVRGAMYNAMLNGATCIAASGNDDAQVDNYPAKFASWGLCVAVGGTDRCGARATIGAGFGSSYGSYLDIVAPSIDVYSTYPRASANLFPPATYYAMSPFGTSFSAAITSGVAASLLSVNSGLADVDIKNVLRSTAINWRGQPTIEVGLGRVAQRDAVRMVDPYLRQSLQGATLATPTSIDSSHTVTLNVVSSDMLSLPDGAYSAKRFDLTYNVTFATPYVTGSGATTPLAWVRVVGTKGWTQETTHYFNYGAGTASAVSGTGATFTTSVYRIASLGNLYVPNTPAAARLVYRAIGTVGGTTAVEPAPVPSGLSIRVLGSPHAGGGQIAFAISGLPNRDITGGVFDVAGRRISMITGKTGPAGQLLLAQDRASVVPAHGAGVYFVHIEQAARSANARIVILE